MSAGRATGYTDFYKGTNKQAPTKGFSLSVQVGSDDDETTSDTAEMRKKAIKRRLKKTKGSLLDPKEDIPR